MHIFYFLNLQQLQQYIANNIGSKLNTRVKKQYIQDLKFDLGSPKSIILYH